MEVPIYVEQNVEQKRKKKDIFFVLPKIHICSDEKVCINIQLSL
jgi:hypothetical protein